MHERMDAAERAREAREEEREQLELLREQQMQQKLDEDAENAKNGGDDEDKPDSEEDSDDNGAYPDKPLHLRGQQRVCKDGNCWYVPSNVATEGLDIATSAGEKRILRDRVAGLTGQMREGFRDGFEQGVNELRYFKQGYNLGFKEAKEEELREQQAEANRKPLVSLDSTLQSMTSNLADKAVAAANGAMDAGKNALMNVAKAAIPKVSIKGGISLWLEEDEKITRHHQEKSHQTQKKQELHKTAHNVQKSHKKKAPDAKLPPVPVPDSVEA
jgi:hypothetical protein